MMDGGGALVGLTAIVLQTAFACPTETGAQSMAHDLRKAVEARVESPEAVTHRGAEFLGCTLVTAGMRVSVAYYRAARDVREAVVLARLGRAGDMWIPLCSVGILYPTARPGDGPPGRAPKGCAR